MDMLKKIKQLLCDHDWSGELRNNFAGYHITFKVCKKCGKVVAKAKKIR